MVIESYGASLRHMTQIIVRCFRENLRMVRKITTGGMCGASINASINRYSANLVCFFSLLGMVIALIIAASRIYTVARSSQILALDKPIGEN